MEGQARQVQKLYGSYPRFTVSHAQEYYSRDQDALTMLHGKETRRVISRKELSFSHHREALSGPALQPHMPFSGVLRLAGLMVLPANDLDLVGVLLALDPAGCYPLGAPPAACRGSQG